MYLIKEFMREYSYEETTCKRKILTPIITSKFPATRNCSVPYRESYTLVCFNNIST